MKTLFLVINSLAGGGAEHVAARLTHEWSKQYNIVVLSLMPLSNEDYDFAGELISLTDNKHKSAGWLRRIIRYSKGIDDLACRYNPVAMIAFLENASISMLLTKIHTKKIVSIRNYVRQKYSGFKLFFWESVIRLVYRKADYVVSPSQLIHHEMINRYKLSKGKCRCIFNPYDIELIRELSQESLDTEEDRAFFCSKHILCNMGHMSEQKGQFHLIKILGELVQIYSDCRLVIIGKINSRYHKKLKNLAKRNNVDNKVYYVGIQRNPFKYIANSQIFVFPSKFEGFPNSLVEAMICGVPVISANCKSGPSEILCENCVYDLNAIIYGEYGILIPLDETNFDNNPDTLTKAEQLYCDAICNLFNDNEQRDAYAKKGRLRASDFSVQKISAQWYNLIND